jgi:hypothetical protein
MLSIEESRKFFKESDLSDEQIMQVRNALYQIVSDTLDEMYESKTDN